MYEPSELALESEILNYSNWILPRESREAQDAIKSIQTVMNPNFLHSLTQKGISKMLCEYTKSLKSVLLKIKLKFDMLLETE